MTESVQIVFIALAALLLGILIPVLMSLRGLLKQSRKTIERLDDDVHRVLAQSSTLLERVDHVASHLERGGGTIDEVFATTDELNRSVRGLADTVRKANAVSASVGPAMVAAVTAFRAARGGGDGDGNGHQEYPHPHVHPQHGYGPPPPPPWAHHGESAPHRTEHQDGEPSSSPDPGAAAGKSSHDLR